MEEDNDLSSPLLEEGDDVESSSSPPSSSAFGLSSSDPTTTRPERSPRPANARRNSMYNPRSAWPSVRGSRRSTREREGSYMDNLILQRQAAHKKLMGAAEPDLEGGEEQGVAPPSPTAPRPSEMDSDFVRTLQSVLRQMREEGGPGIKKMPKMEVRLESFNYRVPTYNEEWGKGKIRTLYNTSPIYLAEKFFRGVWRVVTRQDTLNEMTKKTLMVSKPKITSVLTDINLVLKPSKMYLVLGPPLSGKTSLLKAIGGMLPQGEFPSDEGYDFTVLPGYTGRATSTGRGGGNEKYITGSVSYNNLVCGGDGVDETKRTLFRNLVSFVRQQDEHAPRLTVAETLVYSGMCKDPLIRKNKKFDEEGSKVGLVIAGLGLSHVAETFVGNEQIRGVSGGQRRRVTLGEMLTFDTPLICGDEISTGLDTASTVDILRILSYLCGLTDRTAVVSLLQPSPEAVSLFDEVILLGDGGHVIFSGPTERAREYFVNLGYKQPDGMDDADFLLAVASLDRMNLYQGDGEGHTSETLGLAFQKSKQHDIIMKAQISPWENDWRQSASFEVSGGGGGEGEADPGDIPHNFTMKYQNSRWISGWLTFKRAFRLWTRDKPFVIASIIQMVNVGISGTLFKGSAPSSFMGALYQTLVTIMGSTLSEVSNAMDDREVFYKHHHQGFYSAMSYVTGNAIAKIPQLIINALLLGSMMYWLADFVPAAENFIIFLVLFFTFNLTMSQLFTLFSSSSPTKSVFMASATLTIFANTVFSGFIITPATFPSYWIWLYWCIPASWTYRAMLLNQFLSDVYPDGEGIKIMEAYGFHYRDGSSFTREWIGYSFVYLLGCTILSMIGSAIFLHRFKYEAAPASKSNADAEEKEDAGEIEVAGEDQTESNDTSDTFTPVDLSFNNLTYEVKASKGKGKLRLLNNISGMFRSGRMCALMGESGAGKTTLMDVIALRKGGVFSLGKRSNTGVTGEVLINGFPQEDATFRRCSGYVEQFDVQSAELTIRETIEFSAQLRLEKTSPVYSTPDGLRKHVDDIINTLELTEEADYLVGSKEAGGLSIEQTKRLSIAVELAASPSIIFLDEPTSGLDARAALLVMSAMRKMADEGRTIVATIHQPSSTIFDMFDDLLLLKKGGHVVFHGSLGGSSSNLITYFENLGCNPISRGANPASWMLDVLGARVDGQEMDFAQAWKESSNYEAIQQELAEVSESKDEALKIKYAKQFAVPWRERDRLMAERLVKIYWRSPMFNLSRLALCTVIGLGIGLAFLPERSHELLNEAYMTSLISSIFISFSTIGQIAINSIIPAMSSIRDMYYRHKAAGMLETRSIGLALSRAEWRFIVASSSLFTISFVALVGMGEDNNTVPLHRKVYHWFEMWAFFTASIGIYSYAGQCFVCLVKGRATAIVLANVFVGINAAWCGLIIRPDVIAAGNIFFKVQWLVFPGHYVFESITTTWFVADTREVKIGEGSEYYDVFNCGDVDGVCTTSVSEYVTAFFGGEYTVDNNLRNLLILIFAWLMGVRLMTFAALKTLTYAGK